MPWLPAALTAGLPALPVAAPPRRMARAVQVSLTSGSGFPAARPLTRQVSNKQKTPPLNGPHRLEPHPSEQAVHTPAESSSVLDDLCLRWRLRSRGVSIWYPVLLGLRLTNFVQPQPQSAACARRQIELAATKTGGGAFVAGCFTGGLAGLAGGRSSFKPTTGFTHSGRTRLEISGSDETRNLNMARTFAHGAGLARHHNARSPVRWLTAAELVKAANHYP